MREFVAPFLDKIVSPSVFRGMDAKAAGGGDAKMSDSAVPLPAHAIYSRDQTSPDGTFRVSYAYVDGEKTPLIIEPRVTRTATGEIVLDLWRSGIDGTVGEFTSESFRVSLRNPFGATKLEAIVDLVSRRYAVLGETGPTRALGDMEDDMRGRMDAERQAAIEAHHAMTAAAQKPVSGFRRLLRALFS